MKTRRQVGVFVVLLLVVLILVNALGQRFKLRWDLTDDGRYTLSKATTDMLAALPEAVTVTGYFTEDLPPEFGKARDEFKDMLVEYVSRANGNLVFEFIDPGTNDTLKRAAQQMGIQPFYVTVPGKDKAEQLLAYMSVVVKMADRRSVIPIIKQDTPLEWTLSSAIKEVSNTQKQTIGLVTGHGEAGVNAIPQALRGLNVQYSVEPFTFWDTLPVHPRFHSLIMLDPGDSIPPAHLHWLDEFLASGRGVVIAFNTVKSDLSSSPVAEAHPSDMSRWLGTHGIEVQNTVAIDAPPNRCGQVQVLQQRGQFTFQVPISFPYFPLFTKEGLADHPTTSGLEVVMLQFASPMVYVGDTTLHWTPLLKTSAKSNALPSPVYIDIQKQWTEADFPASGLVLGGALEGSFRPGAPPARMVVIGNGNFCVNGEGQGQQELNPDNVNLLVNAVDWITDETGLIELRNKGVNYRPIEELTEGKTSTIKWVNLLLPVLLAVVYGLLRAQWRKRQRLQRMIPGHVR